MIPDVILQAEKSSYLEVCAGTEAHRYRDKDWSRDKNNDGKRDTVRDAAGAEERW